MLKCTQMEAEQVQEGITEEISQHCKLKNKLTQASGRIEKQTFYPYQKSTVKFN